MLRIGRLTLLPLVLTFLTLPAAAQTPAPAAAPAPVISIPLPDLAAKMDEMRMEQSMRTLIQAGQQRAPDAAVVDPGRGDREKVWLERCKPRLVAAADGMQRYVYAFPDCEGRPLN
jgi:hypothetical protein